MQEQEVNLRDYVRVIRKRKRVILLVFVVAVLVSAIVSFLLPPIYQAKSTIKIGEIVDVSTLEREQIESVIAASQLLKGPQILKKAIEDLKLPYNLKEFGKRISVEPVRGTEDLVEIKIETNNSSEAVNIASYLAGKLMERHTQIKESYENKEKILATYDERIAEIAKELPRIEEDISKAGKEMKDLEVMSQSLSRKMDERMKESGTLSQAESEMLVGQMADVASKLAGLRADIHSKQQRYDTLTKELREAQMEKTKLERTNSVKMYSTEILVPPQESKEPIRPNKRLNILVAAVIGLMVGLGLAFSMEYFASERPPLIHQETEKES